MKRINNKCILILGIVIGMIISVTTVYAVEAYIESRKVSYNNNEKITKKNNVQDSIDELYERSGIHKEKWVDPELNGADPVLKEPLIPVEIKPNGDVYYANLNSEWYNYSEKRWANAVILNDNVSHNVGEKIDDKDIKGYFVWIPRYQYKIWNLGNYSGVITNVTNTQNTAAAETALWRVTGNNTRIIDIKFGNINIIPKMSESEAAIDKYYTHPAFKLGDKDLNGIWVGKFETGESASNVVVKPNVVSLRGKSVKEFFDSAKSFSQNLDSHMMKNMEWGAVAYLSHSQYGIGNEVNINNANDYYTGYSAAPNTNQSTYPSDSTEHTDKTKTQPWDTPVGYLASTTGNISGIYDMSGGAWEYMAACIEGNFKDSGFDAQTLASEMEKGYIDKYNVSSAETSYNRRILGDATGEMGPFYNYFEGNGAVFKHSNWYGDFAQFVATVRPWFSRGGHWSDGVLAGQFYFVYSLGGADDSGGFRLVLAPAN